MSKSRRSLIRGMHFIALLALTTLIAHAQGVIPGRYIVTFEPTVADHAAAGQQLRQAHGFQIRNAYRYALRGMLVEVAPAAGPALVEALRRNPVIRSVVQDRQVTLTAQTDPKGVRRVAAELGIGIRANAGPGIDVAVMDSGIDAAHQDLDVDASRSTICINGAPCVPAANPVQDAFGHGTSVAGAIAALDNDVDLVGVAPGANLISVQVFNSSGSSSDGDIIAGIDHLITLNQTNLVEVVNMSFREICTNSSGANTPCAGHPDFQPLETALQNLTNSGTTIVAASGNDAIDTKFVMPASSSAVIAVSAMADSNGQPGGGGSSVCLSRLGPFCVQSTPDDSYASFANFGSAVDVIAPGADELLLARGGGTRLATGTSFAAPHAAGVAAIFIRDRLNRNEATPLPATVRQALIETGECYESGSGAGDLFHGTTGCPSAWPGDSDGFREPLVRADNIANFGPATPVHDVAVTSVQPPPSPVLTGTTKTVVVNVANQGTQSETFSVSLADNLPANTSGAQEITLGAGASGSLNFTWTPTVIGTHVLTATAATVSGETDTADNSASANVTVQNPAHDVAVTVVDTPASVTQGNMVNVAVTVQNLGNVAETVTVAMTDTPPSGGTVGAVNCPAAFALAAGATTTMNCSWNTSGSSTGTHTLTGTASISTGDSNLTNNSAFDTSNVTAPSTATTSHVGDLDRASVSNGGTWTANVTMTIHNNNHGLVSNATIIGSWSNGTTGTANCTTDGSGQCTVIKSGLAKKTSRVTFSVTGISHASLTYSLAANHDPDGDSNGTSIVVSKP